MTLVLQGSNAKGIDQLLQAVQVWIFPNITDKERQHIMEHFDWMRCQKGNMSVNARIETQEDGMRTRILLEASFKQLPPWKA